MSFPRKRESILAAVFPDSRLRAAGSVKPSLAMVLHPYERAIPKS